MAYLTQNLIVVSNRLPITVSKNEDSTWTSKPGSGGLVTALLPVLRNRGGTWIGWSGTTETEINLDHIINQATNHTGYTLAPVALTEEDVSKFYLGFSNEIVWPLFHDLQSLCNFDPAYWQAYIDVNRKYAQRTKEHIAAYDFIWVHDYHLMHVANELRKLDVSNQIAFFLHIPFPSPDIFIKLPWRFSLLGALLQYDLIGFQTLRDQRNFLQCARALLKEVKVRSTESLTLLKHLDREIRVGNFPISIDYNDFVRRTSQQEVATQAKQLRGLLPTTQLALGIDRLDYTKGIPNRLEAFRYLLTHHPELHERITLIQVVIPSREDIPQYYDLKTRIERMVGEINGQFTKPGGWVPIHYVFRSLKGSDLLAYYRAAEIALITPLKDGMNLVAKEYCACSIEEDCVLILSEFAGAATQLQRGALLVNPYDIEGVARVLHRAFMMDNDERRARMRRMRRAIREQDIFWWVDSFLRAAIAKDLNAFPPEEDASQDDLIPENANIQHLPQRLT